MLTFAPSEQLASLKTVIVAGEACTKTLPEKHHACLPQTVLYNEYGPTEGTVWCSVYEVPSRIESTQVPIGRPIPNTQLYILDKQLRPVPVGIAGEIFIGGHGVAQGYLNHPELTAERFIHHTLGGQSIRLYKTGDLARYLPDGPIEFLGRVDHQIKIRGYRIELGEIETALVQHPDLQEAVVVARELSDRAGDLSLVAYTVANTVSEPAVQGLRDFLSDRLPDYMIPGVFKGLDALPLTPNGKVDRNALPEPDNIIREVEFVAPRTETEELLAEIWTEVLQIDRIGVYDNFFDMGGHSLLVTRTIGRVRDAFEVHLPLRTLFEAPTIAQFVEKLEALLIEELETLSEEEAQLAVEDNRPEDTSYD